MYGLVFWLFYTLLQSPILIAIAIMLLADQFVFGFRSRLSRRFVENRRMARLERELSLNPHDRRARFALAELLVERRRFARAVELIKANLEFGDHDANTLLLAGRACSGAGHLPQALVFLEEARVLEPKRGQGAADLALGEHWLRASDPARAEQALLLFCEERPGSIEGHLRLSRAQAALGNSAAARASRHQAWRNYVEAPRFVRKRDRLWGLRANPLRTLALGGVFLAATIAVAWGLPMLARTHLKPYAKLDEGPELSSVSIPDAAEKQAWKPVPLQLRIRGAASELLAVNLLLQMAGQQAGPNFATDGADLSLDCPQCADAWQAAPLLRAVQRLSALRPGLAVQLSPGGLLRRGAFEDDGVGAFLARQLVASKEDPLFELRATIDGDAAAAEARVRAAFTAASRQGLFPFSRLSLQTAAGRNLEVVIRFGDDTRTALSALEVLRGAVCPSLSDCLPAAASLQSRVSPFDSLRPLRPQRSDSFHLKALPEWFAREDRLLRECSPPMPAAARRVLLRQPSLARLLHGRSLSFLAQIGNSGSEPYAELALDPQGNLVAGGRWLRGSGPVFADLQGETAHLVEPQTGRTRELPQAQRHFHGFFGSSAITVERREHQLLARLSRSGFGEQPILRGVDGADFSFPELKTSGESYGAIRLPDDRLALIEEDGKSAWLVVHSLATHEVRKVALPLHMPRELSLAAAPDGAALVLAVPSEDDASPAEAQLVRVDGDRAAVVASGFPAGWRVLVGVAADAAWLTGEDSGVLAVPLQGGAPAALATSPGGAELSWAKETAKQQLVASAKDGVWLLGAAGARHLFDEPAADAAVSRDGAAAATVSSPGGSRVVLIGEDGAREELVLPAQVYDLEWGQLLNY
jgi:tetratricopeptide (TPR) repeat protein